MPVTNGGFETVGGAPGLADDWAFSRNVSIEEFAAFDSTVAAREDFDSEWKLPSSGGAPFNEDSLFAFVDLTHLVPATFAGLNREEFEFGWDNDAGFFDDFDALQSAENLFDGLPFISGSAVAPYALSVGGVITALSSTGGPASSTSIAAAKAVRPGAGGIFPTGFVGGEQVRIVIDGGTPIVVTFQAADQTAAEVRDRINIFLGYSGAALNGGQIDITGVIQGTDGSVRTEIVTVGALAQIGFTEGTTLGTGNVANLTTGVTAAEVVAIVNGTAGLNAINVKAYEVGNKVRVFHTVSGVGSTVRVNTTAMATTLGLSPLDTVVTASGYSTQAFEDLENEWNLINPTDPVDGGHEISKSGFEDFVDGTVSPSYAITAGFNDAFQVDFDIFGINTITGTVAAGTYVSTAAMAAALQVAFDAALGPGPGDPGDLIVETSPGGTLRIKTVGFEQFRVRRPVANSVWSTLGFTEYDLVLQEFRFRYLEPEVLTPATFDVALEERENFENEWRDNEDSLFAFVDITHLVSAQFDVALTSVEDYENEWTLML